MMVLNNETRLIVNINDLRLFKPTVVERFSTLSPRHLILYYCHVPNNSNTTLLFTSKAVFSTQTILIVMKILTMIIHTQ